MSTKPSNPQTQTAGTLASPQEQLLACLRGLIVSTSPAPVMISNRTAAAMGQMSLSWWQREVRAGRAPAAATGPGRGARWRTEDVMAFWRDMGQNQGANTTATTKARKGKAKSKNQPTP